MRRLIMSRLIWIYAVSALHVNCFPIDSLFKKKSLKFAVWNLAPKELSFIAAICAENECATLK